MTDRRDFLASILALLASLMSLTPMRSFSGHAKKKQGRTISLRFNTVDDVFGQVRRVEWEAISVGEHHPIPDLSLFQTTGLVLHEWNVWCEAPVLRDDGVTLEYKVRGVNYYRRPGYRG